MKKIIFIAIALLTLLFISCSQKACTEEAKLCPGGSYVGRDSNNNCEFKACPKISQIPNPASKFCIEGGGKIEIVTAADGSQSGICTLKDNTKCDEWAYFRGECPSADNKGFTIVDYTEGECSSDTECKTPEKYLILSHCPYTSKCINSKCAVICPEPFTPAMGGKFCSGSCPMLNPPSPTFCPDGIIVDGGKDECGCQLPPDCSNEKPSGEGTKFFCTPEQKKAQICTLEYAPVCGWFNENIKCIRYPCASTYGNKCSACAAENVDFYTEGECPK